VIGWLRALLDNGEAKEREAVKEQVSHALDEAQTELKASREERMAAQYRKVKFHPTKR